MPTDLPPGYQPQPKPEPGDPKPLPGVPEPGIDVPAGDPVGPGVGGDVVDPPGWPQPPGIPGIDPLPSPKGTPTF